MRPTRSSYNASIISCHGLYPSLLKLRWRRICFQIYVAFITLCKLITYHFVKLDLEFYF